MATLRELAGDADWERAVPILCQLWSHREEAFVRSWRDEDDYRLFGWFRERAATAVAVPGVDDADPQLVAVAGVYVQTVLHHERSCWIHDFVVDEAHRGDGHGAGLLAALEDWAAEQDCEHVGLVCAADNDEAADFYEHVGMEAFGTVYERRL